METAFLPTQPFPYLSKVPRSVYHLFKGINRRPIPGPIPYTYKQGPIPGAKSKNEKARNDQPNLEEIYAFLDQFLLASFVDSKNIPDMNYETKQPMLPYVLHYAPQSGYDRLRANEDVLRINNPRRSNRSNLTLPLFHKLRLTKTKRRIYLLPPIFNEVDIPRSVGEYKFVDTEFDEDKIPKSKAQMLSKKSISFSSKRGGPVAIYKLLQSMKRSSQKTIRSSTDNFPVQKEREVLIIMA